MLIIIDLVLVLGLEGLVLVLGCLVQLSWSLIVLVGLVLIVLGLECLVLVLGLEGQVLVNITDLGQIWRAGLHSAVRHPHFHG